MITVELPKWVNQYVGIPFDELDCYELIRKIKREQFNTYLPDLSEEYLNTKDQYGIAFAYYKQIVKNYKKVEKPYLGCCVAFRVLLTPWHFGLYLKDGIMIHSWKGIESCPESIYDKKWKNRLIGFYDYVSK